MGAIIPLIKSDNTAEVINFIEKKNKKEHKIVKYNKDGSICRIHNNKIEGNSSEVFPFKTENDIELMINEFMKDVNNADSIVRKMQCYRNVMLFVCGINIGLRASDLLNLKWTDVYNADGTFKTGKKIMPQKTRRIKKYITLIFNDAFKNVVSNYVKLFNIDITKDEYIFLSQKGVHLDVRSFCRIIKETAKKVGINYNVGTHSCRKTYGYHLWHNADNKTEALSYLQMIFGHSSQKITMTYICIQQEELNSFCNTINLGNDLFKLNI